MTPRERDVKINEMTLDELSAYAATLPEAVQAAVKAEGGER